MALPFKKGIFRLIGSWVACFLTLLFLGSGCATHNVWESRNVWKPERTGTAEGIQIFVESPQVLKISRNPELRIRYTSGNKLMEGSQMPPFPEGCIILKKMDDSLRLLVGLDSFQRVSPILQVHSIKAVVRHEYPLVKRHTWPFSLRLGLAFKPAEVPDVDTNLRMKKIDSAWAPLLKGREPDGMVRTSPHIASDSIFFSDHPEEHMAYFLLGGPSPGGPSGKTDLTFAEDCDVTDFEPLLHKGIGVPFTVEFIEAKEEKSYKNSKVFRALLTVPAIAVDIVTSPLQLLAILTVPLWGSEVLE